MRRNLLKFIKLLALTAVTVLLTVFLYKTFNNAFKIYDVDTHIPKPPTASLHKQIVHPKRGAFFSGETKNVKMTKIDWNDYKYMEFESQRKGIAEHGVAAHLPPEDESQRKVLFSQNGFNGLLSDKISLNRSVKDIRHKGKHVWISEHRKQHYRFVFKKFLPDLTEDAQGKSNQPNSDHNLDVPQMKHEERTISFVDIRSALADALGFYGTAEKVNEILDVLRMNENDHEVLNFRSWCGVIAFSERYLNKLTHEEDPRDEVEIIDFESLERKFSYVNVSDELKQILSLIKSERQTN